METWALRVQNPCRDETEVRLGVCFGYSVGGGVYRCDSTDFFHGLITHQRWLVE